MGVSWVINIPFEENKSTQQVLEGLNQRLLALGAVKSGLHNIDCDVYQAQIPHATQPYCHLMHNSEYPVTSFVILDSSTCLTSDNVIDLILLKLKPLYENKKNLKLECKGSRFTLHDFVFKSAAVQMTNTNSVLGILLEVEYLPSVMAGNCFALLKEMVQGIVGRAVEIPNYLKMRGNEPYTPNDTMQQYLEHFNMLKKSHHPQQQVTDSLSVLLESPSCRRGKIVCSICMSRSCSIKLSQMNTMPKHRTVFEDTLKKEACGKIVNRQVRSHSPDADSASSDIDGDITYNLSETTLHRNVSIPLPDRNNSAADSDWASSKDVNTSDEVSPPSLTCIRNPLSGDVLQSLDSSVKSNCVRYEGEPSTCTRTEYVTMKDSSKGNKDPQQTSSVSVEFSSISKHSENDFIVRVSSTKSPLVQENSKTKALGCSTLIQAAPSVSSAQIQTYPKVQVSSTQSIERQTSDASLQTRSGTLITTRVQTSPTFCKTDVSTEMSVKDSALERTRTLSEKSASSMNTEMQTSTVFYTDNIQWDKTSQNVSLSNARHQLSRSSRSSVVSYKLDFNRTAKSRINSLTEHKPTGGSKTIVSHKLDFKQNAKSKIGSLDNLHHKPLGGDFKMFQHKLDFKKKASSKIGSLDNVNHRPGGGDRQVCYQVVAKRSNLFMELQPFSKSVLSTRKNRTCRNRSPSSDRTTYSTMTTTLSAQHTQKGHSS